MSDDLQVCNLSGRARAPGPMLRKGLAMLRELPLRHGAAIASHPWLVAVLAPVVCILLGAVACLPPTTLGLGFDPAELAAAGSVISRWSRTELALKSGLRYSREPPTAGLPPMPAEPASPSEPPPSAPPTPPIRHLSLSILVSNTSTSGNVLRANVLAPVVDALAFELAGSARGLASEPVVSPLSLGRLIALSTPPPPPPQTDAPPSKEDGLERLLVAPGEAMAAWASPPLDRLPYGEAARFAALVARVAAAADPLAAALAELTAACAEHGAPPCGTRHMLRCAGDDGAAAAAAAAAVPCGARCRVQLGGARVDQHCPSAP